METVTTNLSGGVQKVVINGREYFVAPMTLIVPGVLAGSKGPLYYPPKEIANTAKHWHDMPLVVYHPTVMGEHVSVNTPGIKEKSQIGVVRKPYVEKGTGKLKALGYFDAERTRVVDSRVYNALESGQPIELSTGLYTDNQPQTGYHDGRPYEYIATNYRPDHVAILPDQVGACSLQDGCGVFNTWSDEAREASIESRRARGDAKNLHLLKEAVASKGVAELAARRQHGEGSPEHVKARDEADRATRAYIKAQQSFSSNGETVENKLVPALEVNGEILYRLVQNAQPSDRIDPDKACQILHDKEARGHPLTDQQRKMFGAACGHGGTHNEEETTDNYVFGQAPNPAAAAGQAAAIREQLAGYGLEQPGEEEEPKEPKGKKPTENVPGAEVREKPVKQPKAGSAEAGTEEEEYLGKLTGNALEEVKTFLAYNERWNAAARDKLQKESPEDFAGPHKSFPIKSQKDVHDAARLIGHADDPEAVKSKIKAIAKRKGLSVPDNWKDGGTDNATTMPPPRGLLQHLQFSGKQSSSRAASASLDAQKSNTKESHLIASHSHKIAAADAKQDDNDYLHGVHKDLAKYHQSCAQTAPAIQMNQSEEPMKRKWLEDIVNGTTTNCRCDESTRNAAQVLLNAGKYDKEDDDDDDDMERNGINMHSFDNPTPKGGGKMQAGGKGTKDEYKLSGNAAIDKWLTESNAPPEVKEVVTNARLAAEQQKREIVLKLIANVEDNEQRNLVGNRLMKKSLGELKDMEILLPKAQAPAEQGFNLPVYPVGPGTFNQGQPTVNKDDVIPDQKLDLTGMASPGLLKALGRG